MGWKVAHTPLQERSYVDTAAVWHEDRYCNWISTTVAHSLHLYHAAQLTDPWVEHPQSLVTNHDRTIGRSGGPPVVYRGHIYRIAQDDTSFYGGGLRVFRISVLTLADYKEELVRHFGTRQSFAWVEARLPSRSSTTRGWHLDRCL